MNNIEENKNGNWFYDGIEDETSVIKVLEINEGLCRFKKNKMGEISEDEFRGDWHYFGNILHFTNSEKNYYISFADPKKLIFGELNEMGNRIWENNFVKVEL